MSDAPGQSVSYHVPDDGRWYAQGTIVRVVRGTHIDLIPDPNGDYEVQRCQRQSYLSGDPQLTVEIRKLER
jgi:hypothetical protein